MQGIVHWPVPGGGDASITQSIVQSQAEGRFVGIPRYWAGKVAAATTKEGSSCM